MEGEVISTYLSKNFDPKLINNASVITHYIETLFVEITKSNKKMLIATIYKPNKSDDKLFIDKLLNLLIDSSKKNYDEIILTGDFNFD